MAHTHYKGTGKIHSFRGLLADGEQDKIGIQGSVGAVAWRITKFQIMPEKPTNTKQEQTVKIYREEQSSIDAFINFDDNELLGAAYIENNDNADFMGISSVVIFDNSLFSRNIYVTHKDAGGDSRSCNYYIELEEVKVSKAGMAQLSLAASRRVQSDV